jgi:hypothetical protein
VNAARAAILASRKKNRRKSHGPVRRST